MNRLFRGFLYAGRLFVGRLFGHTSPGSGPTLPAALGMEGQMGPRLALEARLAPTLRLSPGPLVESL